MHITLGNRQFLSKAAALRYIKDLRMTHPLDVPLRAPYHAEVRDLIRPPPRPRREGRSWHQPLHGELKPMGNREFHLHRVDGTSVNFSYTKCLEPKTPALREAKLAMRREVQEGIWGTKWRWLEDHADEAGFASRG
jgi:hypothetical protein